MSDNLTPLKEFNSSVPKPDPEGGVYAWDALEGRLDLGKKFDKLRTESDEFWKIMSEDYKANDKASDEYVYDKMERDEFDDIMVTDMTGLKGGLLIGTSGILINGEKFSMAAPKGHEDSVKTYMKQATDNMRGAAKVFRNMKSDEPDPATADFINSGMERFAKWAEDYARLMDNEKGNLTLGIGRNLTLARVLSKGGSLPIISKLDEHPDKMNLEERRKYVQNHLEEDIRVMGDLDQPKNKRGTFFQDYMAIMDGANDELRVEYNRQEMESTGWDAKKEERYLRELKGSHEKIITAFDRIKKIENSQKYDKVLNSPVSELVGGTKEFGQRDMSIQVGYMKGEVEAIEMGYPSDQLFGLGSFGAIGGKIDRMQRYNEFAISEKQKSINEIDKQIKEYTRKSQKAQTLAERHAAHNKIEEYKKKKKAAKDDLNQLKEKEAGDNAVFEEYEGIKSEVWGKKYSGPETALDAWHKAKGFIDKYPQLGIYQNETEITYIRNANELADKTKDMKDISAAMSEFNTKRSDKWLSSESKQHKKLREASESLQRDMKAYKSGVYQDGPNKGKFMKEEERIALREVIEKKADEVSKQADEYEKSHKAPSTLEGKQRKAGAAKLKSVAAAFKDSISKDRDLELGIDRKLSARVKDTVEVMNAPTEGKDPLSQRMNNDYEEFQRINSNPEAHEREFKIALANVIAGKTLDQGIRMGKVTEEQASQVWDHTSKIIRTRDSSFIKMAEEVYNNPKERQQLSLMEPGEIYAKLVLRKQNEKLREAVAKQNPPERHANKTMQQQGPVVGQV